MIFGEHLRIVLEPVNKMDLARELGISRNAITKWVTDVNTPNVPNLVGLSKFVYGKKWQPEYVKLSLLLYKQKKLG